MKKVLIANRGEIAVRVAATLQQMGLQVVAVYSDADAAAPHVLAADEAFRLVGASVGETYLDVQQILQAASRHGADAIHPGYGFLSENAAFARACEEAGITFIGPSSAVIEAMGDKVRAKAMMQQAGVPVIPGGTAAEADAIGYPLLVKAAAGGGGKGMRRVDRREDLPAALESAAREAGSAFGDDRVFLEKYLERPRHVEFQIFGDAHGNYVHLYERECSIQRRHQKIVEETPSPALDDALRSRMAEAAVAAARTLQYTNAGTVEFILDGDRNFYFLEVNTRLQVEHPVTEMTLQQDLVRAQVLVADGLPLPFAQDSLRPIGHAMECRIYAESPENHFLPAVGTLAHYRPPVGPNVRVDGGMMEGQAVSVHFDPMLAKLCTWGSTREEARARMLWALDRYVVLGVSNNVAFLRRLVAHPDFAAGRLHTHFLEEHGELLQGDRDVPPEVLQVAAWATHHPASRAEAGHASNDEAASPWATAGGWRLA